MPYIPTNFVIKNVGFATASGVSLTATSSPGTTITSVTVNTTKDIYAALVIGSVGLYNGGTSAVNETIQVFIDNNYVNAGVTTVAASAYVQATVNYIFTNISPGTHTIGIAGYGGSLTAQYAELTVLLVGYP